VTLGLSGIIFFFNHEDTKVQRIHKVYAHK
jgi:hypothetical protein